MSCSFPRRVPPIRNSVPAHAAKRYGEFDNVDFNSSNDGGAVFLPVMSIIADRLNVLLSCRHVLKMSLSENYVFLAQEPRRKREGRALRSPVSLLGIGSLFRGLPWLTGMLAMSASWP